MLQVEPRLLVVGGGAAGLAAAAQAARFCPGEVLVVDQAPIISVGTCGLPYLIGGTIRDPAQLILHRPEQLLERGIRVQTSTRVEAFDLSNQRLQVLDLERGHRHWLPYQNLLLAPGGFQQGPGQHYSNVLGPRDLSTSLQARAWLENLPGGRVVVVGAGYLGLELAEAAVLRGARVTLVDPRRPLLGLHPQLSTRLEECLRRQGVELLQAEVVAFSGDSRRARSAHLSDGQELPCELALMATGIQPQHPLLTGLALDRGPRGGVRVNRQGQTSQRHLYAAGDCCEIPDRLGTQPTYQPLARAAALLGQVAGANAVGQSRRFRGCLACVAVKVFELEIAWAGESGQDEVFQGPLRSGYWPEKADIDLCLSWAGPQGPLVGAQAVATSGAVARINTLALAIEQGYSRQQVADMDYCYTPPFASLWDPIVRAAKR